MSARCGIVAMRLPGLDDSADLGPRLSGHVVTCLRCQAEAARYRSLRRQLGALEDLTYPAPQGLVASVMRHRSDPITGVAAARRRLVPSRATVAAAATGVAVVATAGTLAVLLRRLHPPV